MNNPFDNIMQQMKKAQANLSQIQDTLKGETVVGESGAGMVKITCNGNGDILSLDIDDSAVDKANKTMLQDLLIAAMNDLKIKCKRLKEDKMKQLLTQLGLPANFDFPFMG